MKSLVTGGSGFIESYLCEQFFELRTVLLLDNLDSIYDLTGKTQKIKHFLKNDNFELFEIDILAKLLVIDLFKDIHYFFNGIAIRFVIKRMKYSVKTIGMNIIGVLNVHVAAFLDSMVKNIYAASSAVFGHLSELLKKEKLLFPPILFPVTFKMGKLDVWGELNGC